MLIIVTILVVLPLGVTLGGATLAYMEAVKDIPTPQDTASAGPAFGKTELYDRSGQTLLLTASAQEHPWVTLDSLPSHVLQATLLAQDPDFLTQTRFDLAGTFIRLWENTLFGPLAPDASLTGRLVHNVIMPLPEVPTVEDIGRETALVAEIERRYSPQQILEWHLNTDDYGNQAYGLEAAAQTYLGKRALDLTIDEAALLAAIPLAAQYNPFDNEQAARGRQLDLLRAMRAAGNITPDQFDLAAATQTPLLLASDQPLQIAPEFVTYARRQAQDILNAQGRDGARLVTRGGLKIITTLDLDLYYQADCALRVQLARLNGKAASPDTRAGQPCQTALYMPPASDPLAEGAPDNASLVILDVTTGEIRAMVGNATSLNAQPGPTLYPFVYFTGFLDPQGYTPAKMVLDIPSRFPGAQEGLIYTPENPDGRFRGPLNLRDAMAAWLLPPAVQVANAEGLENVLRYAHRIGLNSLGEDGRFDLSLLEQGGAVSLLDMSYAYSVFAAQGDMRGLPIQPVGRGYRQRNPVAVLRIEDNDGNPIWQYDDAQVALNQAIVFKPELGLGYLVNNILADQERRRDILGEVSILDLPRKAAVVSGVTGSQTDNWTVGYTPQIVTGVYFNRADQGAMRLDPLGLEGAAVVWRAVMQYVHDRDGLPPLDWQPPAGIVQVSVCDRSGLLPNNVCPVRNEVFLGGYQPTQTDTYWQSVEINSQTGQRATATTPQELRINKSFFVPPDEARDWWVANNLELPPSTLDTFSQPPLFNAVQILQPEAFAYVGGQVDIRGTLDATNLKYFQVAYGQGTNPSQWIQIGEQHTEFARGATLETWDTVGLSGLYNLLLTVVQSDNSAQTATVQVIVDNTPPTLTLTAGAPGQVYKLPGDSTIALQADVNDDYGLDRVEFYHNGQFLGVDSEAPYGFDWNITRTGIEIFTAVAFDNVGNQTTSEISVEVGRG